MGIKRKIATLATVLGIGGASLIATASPAGAITPCPIGDQGWFQSYAASYHCTIDQNHIVIDRYAGNTYIQGAIDTWIPYSVGPIIEIGAFGSHYATFGVCAVPGENGYDVKLPTANGGPYTVFRYGQAGTQEGVLLWRYLQPNPANIKCHGGGGLGQRGLLY